MRFGYYMRLASLVLLCCVPSAWAKSLEPAIKHVEDICTPEGGFGRHFAEAGYGHVDSVADEEWAPFRHLTISTQSAYRIAAEASFDAAHTQDENVAIARRFFHALDKAVAAKQRFPHRDAHDGGITFSTGEQPDTGLLFDIRQDGTHVLADCVKMSD